MSAKTKKTAAGTASWYAQPDEVVKDRTGGKECSVLTELVARYGPVESWDTRTHEEYSRRTGGAL